MITTLCVLATLVMAVLNLTAVTSIAWIWVWLPTIIAIGVPILLTILIALMGVLIAILDRF